VRERSALVMVAVLGLGLLAAETASAGPGVGDRAPDFTLAGSDGRSYALSQFVGERGVVLAWFPKAFTPG
jgi:peroxiredoxin Q/BCP